MTQDDYVHFEDCGCEKCLPREEKMATKDRCQKFPWCVIAPDGHPGECSSIPYKLWAHSKECPDCKSTDRNKLLDPCVFEGHKTHPWHKEEREKILNQLAGHEGRSSSPAPQPSIKFFDEAMDCSICGRVGAYYLGGKSYVCKVCRELAIQCGAIGPEGAPLPAPSPAAQDSSDASVLKTVASEAPTMRSEAIGSQSPHSLDRSNKDYAIEFGGYLATAAEGYMDAINKYSAGQCDSDYLSDHWRGLQNAVGEFRKRAQRAKETPSSAPVEPEVIRQWRDPKVAWLSPWHKEIEREGIKYANEVIDSCGARAEVGDSGAQKEK